MESSGYTLDGVASGMPAGNHTAEIKLHALPHTGMVLVTPRGDAVERYTSAKNYVLQVVASPLASSASSSLGHHRDQKVSRCAEGTKQWDVVKCEFS